MLAVWPFSGSFPLSLQNIPAFHSPVILWLGCSCHPSSNHNGLCTHSHHQPFCLHRVCCWLQPSALTKQWSCVVVGRQRKVCSIGSDTRKGLGAGGGEKSSSLAAVSDYLISAASAYIKVTS